MHRRHMREQEPRENEQIVDGGNKDVKEVAPEEIGDGHIKRPEAQRGEGRGHLWQRGDEGDEQSAFNKAL